MGEQAYYSSIASPHNTAPHRTLCIPFYSISTMYTVLYNLDRHDIQTRRPTQQTLIGWRPCSCPNRGCQARLGSSVPAASPWPLMHFEMDTSGLRISPRSPLVLVTCFHFGTQAQEPFCDCHPPSARHGSLPGAQRSCGLVLGLSNCSRPLVGTPPVRRQA